MINPRAQIMMFLSYTILATLTLAIEGGILSPLRSGSNGDQYRWRKQTKGGGQTEVEMSRFLNKDATDREAIGINNLDKLVNRDFEPSTKTNNQESEEDETRTKRSYYPYSAYTYQVPQIQSISAWRPSIYPIQRPYFVPIYGIDGRIPVYIPQQPFYINPGTPSKNPLKPPYVGPTYLPPINPTYLPPVTPSSPTDENTTMPTDNRFGGNDEDDRPIWDNGNEPGFNKSPSTAPSVIPTRKPSSSIQPTFPPLVHKDGNIPASSINHLSSNDVDNNKAITSTPTPKQPPGPSRCVWAIVSCCSTSSKEVSYNCFDQLGCSGPFWDVSPCETEYAKAAIESALNFYNSRT